jgi:type II secretion system protein G
MQKLNQKGFTIIELLVVIVIIGILVALTLPNLFAAQARGRDSDRKNELKNLQQKLETHFGDNDQYPTALAGLTPAPTADETAGPRNDAYTYTPAPAGCDNAATNCDTYTLDANLENDGDKDAIDAAGTYRLISTNQ